MKSSTSVILTTIRPLPDLLVQTHSDALMLYINGYLHDIHESEDLMIEAFARVFARPRPIREAGCFRAYLYKIGRNLARAIKDGSRLHLFFLTIFRLSSRVVRSPRLHFLKMNGAISSMTHWLS